MGRLRQSLLRHVGLIRPYRFERTLIVLAAVANFAFLAVGAAFLAARDDLNGGTPRAWYFVYLIVLLERRA
ncbi:MAG: hypothetical protein FJX11_01625 [Alphaproteobacteria bacterium]|nr:hypothetical protein [Alphaproteobacteria bacterium]